MNDGPTSDLDALANILLEAHTLLGDIDLPEGRARRCLELVSTASAIVAAMKKQPPKSKAAAALGSKGGKRTLSKLGADHFRKLAALRKNRAGGRPKKSTS